VAWELCCSLYLYLMRVSASGGYVCAGVWLLLQVAVE